MEPDDGDNRAVDERGIRKITHGRFIYTSLPVRWDDEGRVAAVALHAYDVETGVTEWAIVAPGTVDGDASPVSAPHEQDGPLPADYVLRLHPERQYETACPKCGAAPGSRCINPRNGLPYEDFVHSARRRALNDRFLAEGRG